MCYNNQGGDIMRKSILLLGIILLPSILLAQGNSADKVRYIQVWNDNYYVKNVAVAKVSEAVEVCLSGIRDVEGSAKVVTPHNFSPKEAIPRVLSSKLVEEKIVVQSKPVIPIPKAQVKATTPTDHKFTSQEVKIGRRKWLL